MGHNQTRLTLRERLRKAIERVIYDEGLYLDAYDHDAIDTLVEYFSKGNADER